MMLHCMPTIATALLINSSVRMGEGAEGSSQSKTVMELGVAARRGKGKERGERNRRIRKENQKAQRAVVLKVRKRSHKVRLNKTINNKRLATAQRLYLTPDLCANLTFTSVGEPHALLIIKTVTWSTGLNVFY